ncbi:MAG TPA: ATP-binding protein [Candidatus Sulfotelmatobacter sp.]|nr:ATP-binding protein [Candidatus Sulfotelmatobacter sp.]
MRKRTGSISRRLTMMSTLVSGVALLLACAGFFTYDQITFRQSLIRMLSAQAQIVGSNSVSAILFNDPQAAASTLSALRSSQNISSAGIFTAGRHPLAEYSRDASDAVLNIPELKAGEIQGYWFHGNHIVLVRRILSEGKPIGFVYLRASLAEIDQRLRRYALIALGVLLVSLIAANAVSSSFRRSVAQPIIGLAETAQQISRDKNYDIRVSPPAEQNELAVLVNSFNEMVSELRKSHDELEQRVSERTRELVATNRELEAFSYSVSHDLRGPLDAINGFSYLLLNQFGAGLDPQRRELVENIRASSRRMTALIDDLLNLSRVTSSAMRSEKVDLTAMARSIMEELCAGDPKRKVNFVAADEAEVQGDPRLLRIMMDNLLRNAWKYTSHHSSARIEFGTVKEDKRTVYFVKDDGSGFEAKSAERLFQPFQRLHSASEFPGNGVGLATVRRIVQRHGGDVWAEAAVEQGATFYFTIGQLRTYDPA